MFLWQELQNERDLLREKMDEQLVRITSIQSRLDEQRQRAEELQRAGTSDLNLKVYNLQEEVNALKETVSSRDKQISVLKNHLTQSKEIIDKQESEIASYNCSADGSDSYNKVFIEKLEARIASKEQENKSLREKIRTEMITKVALPDLMETVLADKTDEIEYLKEQLESREKELKTLRDSQIFAKAEEKLSEYFSKHVNSDLIDNDYVRKGCDSGTRLSLVSKLAVNIGRPVAESFQLKLLVYLFRIRQRCTAIMRTRRRCSHGKLCSHQSQRTKRI